MIAYNRDADTADERAIEKYPDLIKGKLMNAFMV